MSRNGTTELSRDCPRPVVDLERREVSLAVMHDAEIYRLELERLWAKAWIVVGHESEVAGAGDYVTRYIGEDPVIVTRDRKGAIQVLLNVCPHRGMQVCRAEFGRSNSFKCAYHGWAFGQDGQFLGAPVAAERMQGDMLDKSELGLKRARVETYTGLIFATFDPDAPPLRAFLGDAAWYLDLNYGRTAGGMEVVGPPHRWIIDGNWKLAAEQFVGGDGYHVFTLHRSMLEMGVIGRVEDITAKSAPAGHGIDVSFREGHSFRCVAVDFSPIFGAERAATMTTREKLTALPPPGLSPEMVPGMFERYDEEQLRILADMAPTVGGIFPNVATFNFLMPHPDGPLGAVVGFHTFVPKGPDKLEFWHWTLVEKDAPEELKTLIARTSTLIVGATGMIEGDDGECWPLMQRGGQGAVASGRTMKYHALVGENKPADWPGGGIVSEGFTKDDGQWHWWMRYREFLEGAAW